MNPVITLILAGTLAITSSCRLTGGGSVPPQSPPRQEQAQVAASPSPGVTAAPSRFTPKEVDYTFLCEVDASAPECAGLGFGTETKRKAFPQGKATRSPRPTAEELGGEPNCCDSENRCTSCREDQNCIKDVTKAKGPWCSPKGTESCGGEYPKFCSGADGDHSCCPADAECATTSIGAHAYCKTSNKSCRSKGPQFFECGSDACCNSSTEVCVDAFVDFCSKKPDACDSSKGETACKGTAPVGNPPVENIRCCKAGQHCVASAYPNCVADPVSSPTPGSSPTASPTQTR